MALGGVAVSYEQGTPVVLLPLRVVSKGDRKLLGGACDNPHAPDRHCVYRYGLVLRPIRGYLAHKKRAVVVVVEGGGDKVDGDTLPV